MNNSYRIILSALFLLFCFGGPSWAEDSPAPQEVTPAAQEVTPAPQEVTPAPDNIEQAPAASAAVDPGNITVNFKGADIKTILAYISEVSGVDIVPAPDVKGVVDLKLTNKPWKVALDVILRNYGFAYEREGDIIRVVTVSQLKQEELASQTYKLNYSKSKDVVATIKNIVSEKGKVTYDERTNTVIVTDIPTNLYKISQVITKLDKRTQQVLIEARVIETVLGDTEKLGIDWNVKISASGARRPITFPFEQFKVGFGKNQDGAAFFPQVQTGTSASTASTATTSTVTTVASFPTVSGGVAAFPFAGIDQFTFGTLDFTQFSAVLEMLKARAKTDVVSNPRIATLNNQEAIINVGQTLNMPKYERNSSTGKMEITGYDAKDLGIILKVTPHINELNEIVVDLAPQITDLLRYDTLDATSGVVAPVFSARMAKTQVMIKDGQTIFIGGLIKENNVTGRKKLPIIGDLCEDIPILGLLTSKKETIKEKTELIFFISVNIMTGDNDIASSPRAENIYSPAYTMIKTPEKAAKEKGKKK
ncbi:MAG: secretin N-terminal domain-containing protein [Candidatus Omnitrophota bacterium]|nr:secretin N-terminal domain-containing protein [Candidatus Omnitrophota bacterium]